MNISHFLDRFLLGRAFVRKTNVFPRIFLAQLVWFVFVFVPRPRLETMQKKKVSTTFTMNMMEQKSLSMPLRNIWSDHCLHTGWACTERNATFCSPTWQWQACKNRSTSEPLCHALHFVPGYHFIFMICFLGGRRHSNIISLRGQVR